MTTSVQQTVIDIIKGNIYLTLGTCNDNIPWTAPLFYACDTDYNFYFISQTTSQHSVHIASNPLVSFSIFDSKQPEGTGNGVQGSGTVRLLEEHELEEAFKWYKTSFVPMTKEFFTVQSPYRFYKLIPTTFFVQDPESEVDKRVEVSLQ